MADEKKREEKEIKGEEEGKKEGACSTSFTRFCKFPN